MSETIDPITILRDSIQQKKEIKFVEGTNEISFGGDFGSISGSGGIKLPRDVQTAWSRKDGKGYYNIGALWFLNANKDLKQPDYLKKAGNEGF